MLRSSCVMKFRVNADQLCFTTATTVNQTTEVGKWQGCLWNCQPPVQVEELQSQLLSGFVSCPNWFPGWKTGLFLHNFQWQDKNLEHLSKQSYIICMVQIWERFIAKTCSCQTSVNSTLKNPIRRRKKRGWCNGAPLSHATSDLEPIRQDTILVRSAVSPWAHCWAYQCRARGSGRLSLEECRSWEEVTTMQSKAAFRSTQAIHSGRWNSPTL